MTSVISGSVIFERWRNPVVVIEWNAAVVVKWDAALFILLAGFKLKFVGVVEFERVTTLSRMSGRIGVEGQAPACPSSPFRKIRGQAGARPSSRCGFCSETSDVRKLPGQ